MQKTPANARVLKRNPHLRRDDNAKNSAIKIAEHIILGIFQLRAEQGPKSSSIYKS